MTDEEIFQRAKQDRHAMQEKVVGVTFAQLGDGTCEGYREANFSREKPLLVRISKAELCEYDDVVWDNDPDGPMDTYWGAEALPGQLAEKDYVSWIDGPAYYADGRRVTPTWAQGEEQLP